jgi:phosphohistidine phosphatase
MKLYLIRHTNEENGDDDDSRPVSKKGAKRFAQVVKMLRALDVRFDLVLHSPRLRAVQTAELLHTLLDGSFEVTPLLAELPSRALLEACSRERVALVGHGPSLSALLSWLVIGKPSTGRFEMKKGAVACLEGDAEPGAMKLVWLLPPRLARAR